MSPKRFPIIHGSPYEDNPYRNEAFACTECGRIDDVESWDDGPRNVRCPGPDGRGGCFSDVRSRALTGSAGRRYRDNYKATFGHD